MIKEWLFKHIFKNSIVFLKDNEDKEYFLVKDVIFDEGDLKLIIFESQKVEKKNEIRRG